MRNLLNDCFSVLTTDERDFLQVGDIEEVFVEQHAMENATERPDISSASDVTVAVTLTRHERFRSDEIERAHRNFSQNVGRVASNGIGNTKVDQF